MKVGADGTRAIAGSPDHCSLASEVAGQVHAIAVEWALLLAPKLGGHHCAESFFSPWSLPNTLQGIGTSDHAGHDSPRCNRSQAIGPTSRTVQPAGELKALSLNPTMRSTRNKIQSCAQTPVARSNNHGSGTAIGEEVLHRDTGVWRSHRGQRCFGERSAVSPLCAPADGLCNTLLHIATQCPIVQHLVAEHHFLDAVSQNTAASERETHEHLDPNV